MNEMFISIGHYGYSLIFGWVLAEQLGAPLPSFPIFLVVGATAAAGHMNLVAATLLGVMAALIADLFWYRVAKKRGTKIVGRLCQTSLEPDSCVRRTENFIARRGAASLLISKFFPGISIATAPLAGAFGIPVWQFVIYDAVGAFIWIGSFEALGFIFHNQLEAVALYAERAAGAFGALLAFAVLGGYLFQKYLRRRHMLQQLKMARISPEELKDLIDSGSDVTIVDLRHPLDFLPQPYTIPGAIRIPLEELEARKGEIPTDRDVVLYCTCPSEASSVMMAKRLQEFGIKRVRPLAGGYFGWRDREFPLVAQFTMPQMAGAKKAAS